MLQVLAALAGVCLLSLALHSVPRRTPGITSGGLCTTVQPCASATSASSDGASASACVRGGKEQMGAVPAVLLMVFGFILPINHADM